MTAEVRGSRLAAALWECDQHRATLAEALADRHYTPAADFAVLAQDSGRRPRTDQLRYRFTKLQDAMREQLVPTTLGRLSEPHEAWPMRDRLDSLERLGFLDADAWLQ